MFTNKNHQTKQMGLTNSTSRKRKGLIKTKKTKQLNISFEY
jgi:hypothetical protein